MKTLLTFLLTVLERVYLFVRHREYAVVLGLVGSVLDVVATELAGTEFTVRSLVPALVAVLIRFGVFSKSKRDNEVVEAAITAEIPTDVDYRLLQD